MGLLVLCGAPIGNPGDASPRLREALMGADVIAAEDTRRLHRLAAHWGVSFAARVCSYHDANESARATGLLGELQAGRTVAVITDAGMPGVSDPGYRLVALAAADGHRISVVPGPSAVTSALAVSGLPSDRWVFEGFLPRRSAARQARLAELAGERRTLVVLEAPHRLAPALADLADAFGDDRRAVVCRELSKTYEEIVRGGLGELAAWARAGVRGEVTLVVAGAGDAVPSSGPAALAAAVTQAEEAGLTRKEALAAVAAQAGVAKRTVYDAVLAARAAPPA